MATDLEGEAMGGLLITGSGLLNHRERLWCGLLVGVLGETGSETGHWCVHVCVCVCVCVDI